MNYVIWGLMTVFVYGNSWAVMTKVSHKHKNGTALMETIQPYKTIKRRKEREVRQGMESAHETGQN